MYSKPVVALYGFYIHDLISHVMNDRECGSSLINDLLIVFRDLRGYSNDGCTLVKYIFKGILKL